MTAEGAADRTSTPFIAPAPWRVYVVEGADRLDYLDDVLSQQLRDVPSGQARSALYLDAHGAPQGMFDVVALEDRVLLLVPDAEDALSAVELLANRTFLADATFTATELQVRALRELAVPDLPLPPQGRVEPVLDTIAVGRHDGADLIGSIDELDAAERRLAALGVERSDRDRLDSWRVSAGEPAWGREVAAPHLPEELGLLPTHVHLAKGCYPGQEAVARMWMLGQPRRRLARVAVEGQVRPGWETGEGRARVTVTSTTADGRQALAFVPSGAGTGDTFAGDDATVRVTGFVGEGRAVPGHDPAVTRRRDRRVGSRQ
ncbi:MAG: hypothetical protein KY469_16975 [Actinobacteria bacterium]|nr:hypothetical protein [Actinomycetota bacterium]